MSWINRLAAFFQSLFGRARAQNELDAEVGAYFEILVERYMEQGMSRTEAHRAARVKFESPERVKQKVREAQMGATLEAVGKDVRYAVRMLAKNPGFTVAAVLTLALGIGSNSAIFSTINAVLLRPLPYPNADRLVFIWATDARRGVNLDVASYPDFEDWKNQSKSFAAMAAFTRRGATISSGDHAEVVSAVQGTPGIFELFGVSPQLGRTFLDGESEAGASHVALLSDGFWKERFAGSADALGKILRINEEPYTIVGVMPPDFQIMNASKSETIYTPLVRDRNRAHGFLNVLGRLRPGVSMRAAQAELSGIARQIGQAYPKSHAGIGANLVPLVDAMAGGARAGMFIFLGVVTLVLMIACANVANLMLARGASRHKEIAVRAALGAGRKRILQQLLTESTVLALAGGALGLLFSAWMARLLVVLLARQFTVPRLESTHTDWRVLGFTLAVSLVTGIFFGVVFAVSAASPNLNNVLRESGRLATAGSGSRRLRSALVIIETAMALVLLAGAGSLLKSLLVMRSTAPGFRSENMLTVEFRLPAKKFAHDPERILFFQSVLARAAAVPGVRSAALVTDLPMGGGTDSYAFHILGKPDPAPGESREALFNVASPGYFRTMGIPVRAGREFGEVDSAQAAAVVVINESAARQFWPGEDPLGKQISLQEVLPTVTAFTVVGVAGDTRQIGLGIAPRAEIFLNYLQPGPPWPWLVMVARTDADPKSLAGTLKSALQQVDTEVPVINVRTVDAVLSRSLAQPQLFSILLGVFAMLALVLAAVGLYGVVSYTVEQRTHEVGIRMALGADRGQVLQMVLRQGLGLAMAGSAIGILGALGATRMLVHLVPSTRANDPLLLSAVCSVLLGVAVAASYFPARRATKVDPVVALRYE